MILGYGTYFDNIIVILCHADFFFQICYFACGTDYYGVRNTLRVYMVSPFPCGGPTLLVIS